MIGGRQAIAMLLALVAGAGVASAQPQAALPARTLSAIDSVFTRWATDSTPGCAVGAARHGQRLLARAYGMANLEHPVANTVETVFEAGSVSKQFTAAAILLLVADGKLALADDVRKYVPELPDYGSVITVDHLLTHTSGLRDWGSVMALTGAPRGERVYTNADALDIVIRQRRLNHAPGALYSYTNSGYTLLAVIVERVSGMPLPDFTRDRMFRPLGMSSTIWRSDFRRLVRRRATAYDRGASGYAQAMPFEDTYGHAALLTTVGDLLIWNEALHTRWLGDSVAATMGRKMILTSGETSDYGRGLRIGTRAGHDEIAHSGTTAGYNAWLGRYPAEGLSIALLCNAPVSNSAIAHAIADKLLPAREPRKMTAPAATQPEPRATSSDRPPTAEELSALTGRYHSEEAAATYSAALEDGVLVLRVVGRRTFALELTPVGPDMFRSGSTTVKVHRTPTGDVQSISLTSARVRELHLQKVRGTGDDGS